MSNHDIMDTITPFQQYQLAFTAHIRNPSTNARPAGVADRRMAVYRQAIFNNFFNIISACFPVCRQTLGARSWNRLIRDFVAKHVANTPIFREIPQCFVTSLMENEELPAYIRALAHYEWIELAVSHLPEVHQPLSVTTDLLDEALVFAPHQLLAYEYPVHKISRKCIPEQPSPTFMLVYRRPSFSVEFIELNAITFRLLSLLQTQESTGRQALIKLAEAMAQPPQAMIDFGVQLLNDLLVKQALLGSTAPP